MIIVAILRIGVEGLRHDITFSRNIKFSKEASEGLYGERRRVTRAELSLITEKQHRG